MQRRIATEIETEANREGDRDRDREKELYRKFVACACSFKGFHLNFASQKSTWSSICDKRIVRNI